MGFIVDSTTTGSTFDIYTLNYAIPGLLRHYGFVNKEALMNVTVIGMTDFKVHPEQQVVECRAVA
jgi:hypothetical protein